MSELFVGNYFDNYTFAPVTDDMIQFAQEKLKVELPESYLTLMTTDVTFQSVFYNYITYKLNRIKKPLRVAFLMF